MKKFMKIMLAALICIMGLSLMPIAQASSLCSQLKLTIGSKQVSQNNVNNELDVAPYLQGNYTYVPLRFISENLGATVKWNKEAQQVSIITNSSNMILTVNSNTAIVNDKTTTLDAPLQIIKDRTMVPLRFVSENLNSNVTWNQSNKTILIVSKDCSSSQMTPNPTDHNNKLDTDKVKKELESTFVEMFAYVYKKDAEKYLSFHYNPTEALVNEYTKWLSQNNYYLYEFDSLKVDKIEKDTAIVTVDYFTKLLDTTLGPEGKDEFFVSMANLVTTKYGLTKKNGTWQIVKMELIRYVKSDDTRVNLPK